MSGYPPPPPQNPYDRNAWRAQQRLLQAQQKAYQQQQRAAYKLQRAQAKAQQRALRHGSIVGPLLLIIVGVIFLLTQTGRLTWDTTFAWYGRWWPAVMIGAGLLLVAEWAWGRQQHAAGKPYSWPVLGSGVVALLILMMFVGFSVRFLDDVHGWPDQFFSHGWNHMMGGSYESDDSLKSATTTGQTLVVRNAHGDVTVTGSSSDGQVHISVHKQVYAWKNEEASSKENEIQPVLSNDGSLLVVTVGEIEGGSSDLTIETPHDMPISIEASHGDVDVSEVHAPVTITTSHGDVQMASIDGIITLHVSDDDKDVTGHSLTGPITVQGRGGGMTFTDVANGVSLDGDFFGSTHFEHISGPVRFNTSRTHFEAARLDGEFDVDGGSDLSADQLLGPVKLDTHNRNITFDRVQGAVDITNRNGTVNLTNTAPLGSITIVNAKGSVDVGVPENTGFVITASTKHGDLENDFDLTNSSSDDQKSMKGTVHGGGPMVSVITTDGDVTVRKSSLPRLAPLAPRVPITPIAPPVPKSARPAKPAAPAAPTPPASPAVPAHGPRTALD